MELSDILTVQIDDEMRDIAEKCALGKSPLKTSSTHLNVVGGNRHDYYASLGQQAVERWLDSKCLRYNSTRTETLASKEKYDLLYEDQRIDVKAKHGKFKNDYFYAESFLVMKHQIDRGILDDKDYLCFVLIGEGCDKAYIYGVISISDFMDKATEVNPENTNGRIKYDNKSIKAYYLKPFIKYVYRA